MGAFHLDLKGTFLCLDLNLRFGPASGELHLCFFFLDFHFPQRPAPGRHLIAVIVDQLSQSPVLS